MLEGGGLPPRLFTRGKKMSDRSISEVSFYEVCRTAMNDLIEMGSIEETDSLPEITAEDLANQLPITAKSIVQDDDETSEEYAAKLVYFSVKDLIELKCE